MLGVSIVICCFNSRARLGETLGHLARQIVPPGLPWEIIIVDNGSTDGTAAFAEKAWGSQSAAPLRVVSEPQPGLSQARARGLREAGYELISLVDDDNWVGPDWVRLISEIMTQHPDVGACGGLSIAASEQPLPAWFAEFARTYAVGEIVAGAGDVTWSKGYLWGAGLTLRKSAWQRLLDQGFHPQLTDRLGTSLSSGGDTELCKALRLAGWKLHYDPRLSLRHFIPSARLEWAYLRKLRRAMGASSVAIDAYDFAVRTEGSRMRRWGRESWFYQTGLVVQNLLACGSMIWSARKRAVAGRAAALQAEWWLGRWQGLLCGPRGYAQAVRAVRQAPWRIASPSKTSAAVGKNVPTSALPSAEPQVSTRH